jgi:hypothetical protein
MSYGFKTLECGTTSQYRRGCRCKPCTVAERQYRRGYKKVRRHLEEVKEKV